MTNCEKCSKKLGIIEGYIHPTLGKKHLLCSPCYDKVSESVENWSNFVLSNSFIRKSSNNGTKIIWEKIASNFNQILEKNPNIFDDRRNQILLKTVLKNVN
jgi:hypothetical protein